MQFGEVKTAFMANKNTKLAGQPQQPWPYRVFYMAGCIEDLAEVVAAALWWVCLRHFAAEHEEGNLEKINNDELSNV